MLNQENADRLFVDRYSFVSFCPYLKQNKLFVGTTNFAGDILAVFDLKTKSFTSCNYHKSIRTPLEIKIHKGLTLNEVNDSVYFGTATVSDIPDTINSGGGQLIRYDIKNKQFEKIASPTPGEFYQSTIFDIKRNNFYMHTMVGNAFCHYNINENKLKKMIPMESIPHNGVLSKDGKVWSVYGVSSHAFYFYDPDTETFHFPKNLKIPDSQKSANIMYPGAGPVDCMVEGPDGNIYAGCANGEVFMIDVNAMKLEYLGKPFLGMRIPGMAFSENGDLYLCGGTDNKPYLSKYSIREKKMETLGNIVASDGQSCYRCHEIMIIDNTVFVGETDNPVRSGYLWEVELE